MTQKLRQLPGFTLLELMIATVLASILLLSASALFMTFMIGNASTNARRQMSAEGTQMQSTLEFHIRNAKSAKVGASSGTGSCTSGGTSGAYLTLTKLDGSAASACFITNQLYFFSTSAACAANANNQINSGFVVVASPQFTCKQATNGKQTIQINFTLGTSVDASITSPFSTVVQLRNS